MINNPDILSEVKIDLIGVDHLLNEGMRRPLPIITRGQAARTGSVQGAIMRMVIGGLTRGRGVSTPRAAPVSRASTPRREAFRPSKIDDPNERYRKFREITDRDFREQFLRGNEIDRKNFMRNFSSRIGSYQVDNVSRSRNPPAAMRKLLEDLRPQSNNLQAPEIIPNQSFPVTVPNVNNSRNLLNTLMHKENL